MANKNAKDVKRFIENVSKEVATKAYNGGGSSTIVYNNQIEEFHYIDSTGINVDNSWTSLHKIFIEGIDYVGASINISGCPELSLIEGNLETVRINVNAIDNLPKLTEISLPNASFISFENDNGMFINNCNNLTTITLGGLDDYDDYYCGIHGHGEDCYFLCYCPSLQDLYINMVGKVFPFENASWSLTNVPKITVHVPADLVDQYKADSFWGDLFTNDKIDIVAIEE